MLPPTESAVSTATTPSATARKRVARKMVRATKVESRSIGPRASDAVLAAPWGLRSRDAAVGTTVIDTIIESATDTDNAMAMSRKSWPTSSSIRRIGTNTTTVVIVEASTAPQTSVVASIAARMGVFPRSM